MICCVLCYCFLSLDCEHPPVVEVYFELVTAEKFKTTLIKKVLIESSDIFLLVPKPRPLGPI